MSAAAGGERGQRLKEDIGLALAWFPELAEPACDDCPGDSRCCVAHTRPFFGLDPEGEQ